MFWVQGDEEIFLVTPSLQDIVEDTILSLYDLKFLIEDIVFVVAQKPRGPADEDEDQERENDLSSYADLHARLPRPLQV